MADKHNNNTNKSLKVQRSSTIKKNKDKNISKKKSIKTTKTKAKSLNSNGSNKDKSGYKNGIGVNRSGNNI